MSKNLAILFCFLGFTACVAPQMATEQVPQVIQKRLMQEYQGVKMLRWQKEGNNYVADFRRAKYDYQYIFDQQANILQRKEDIRIDLLPSKIAETIQQKFPQYKMREASKLICNEKDTMYLAEIQRGMKFYQLYFKTNAMYVQKEILLPEDKSLLIDTSFFKGL